MNRRYQIPFRQRGALISCGPALILLLASISPLGAQAASGIAPTPANAPEDASGKKVAAVTADKTPSRFVGANVREYTASHATFFSMNRRSTDPFGLNQDPSAKPAPRKTPTSDPTRRQPAIPPTPLRDIVRLIRVTTIMPGEKKFLVGVRSFSESDEFSLNFRGKRMRMKVVKVSSGSILFRNLETGESASLETGLLPPGMVPGSDMIQPPGLVSPQEDVPLELGTGNDSDANK